MNPYLEVVIAAILFGTAGVFVKILNLPATTISFFRVAVPTVVLFVYFISRGKNIFKDANKTVILLSLISALRIFYGYLHFYIRQ
ncbi:MAG TPA: hypothetical protein VLG67_01860 [Candidatus Saccharimonadales bacterium]|nr:hypothetical protein [Candidatus Saccharimonadales bacterium]